MTTLWGGRQSEEGVWSPEDKNELAKKAIRTLTMDRKKNGLISTVDIKRVFVS